MRQHFSQMNSRRLGRIIREMMLRCLDYPRDRRDIHNSTRPSLLNLRPLLQQRQKRCRREETLHHIRPVRFVPLLHAARCILK